MKQNAHLNTEQNARISDFVSANRINARRNQIGLPSSYPLATWQSDFLRKIKQLTDDATWHFRPGPRNTWALCYTDNSGKWLVWHCGHTPAYEGDTLARWAQLNSPKFVRRIMREMAAETARHEHALDTSARDVIHEGAKDLSKALRGRVTIS